jgi:hypothetical protein
MRSWLHNLRPISGLDHWAILIYLEIGLSTLTCPEKHGGCDVTGVQLAHTLHLSIIWQIHQAGRCELLLYIAWHLKCIYNYNLIIADFQNMTSYVLARQYQCEKYTMLFMRAFKKERSYTSNTVSLRVYYELFSNFGRM